MASEELTSSLKLAWEAIEAGEYKQSLQHCKAALKINKTSYDALMYD